MNGSNVRYGELLDRRSMLNGKLHSVDIGENL